MNQRRLLAIFAHPDDESFGPGGTLARYACQGVEVHVCTVTGGAAGSYDPHMVETGQTSALARVRRQELECASRILGVHLHLLDYRDSGMAGAPDNEHPDSLYQADLEDVARDLLRLVYEVCPHVILTHDPTGGYFHPDHVKVNQAVTRVWDMLSEAWRPARLYYSVLPRSAVRWFLRFQRLRRQDPRRFGQNQDIDLTQLGVPDEQIHVRLDVAPYLPLKEQASACHRSQGGGGALRMLPRLLRRRFFRYEHFVQARPPGAGPHDDFFNT
jgi:LmbE family N-acetylglucosaminyl deacetylase